MPERYDYFGHLMPRMYWTGSAVVDYGRRQLSQPHPSDRRKRGTKAKAQRRAKARRRRKRGGV